MNTLYPPVPSACQISLTAVAPPKLHSSHCESTVHDTLPEIVALAAAEGMPQIAQDSLLAILACVHNEVILSNHCSETWQPAVS
jgi:hypothetical protein